MSIGEELTNVRVDQLIESVGRGIALAQYELDKTGLQIALLMSGQNEKDRVLIGAKKYSLLELGFTPTFYQYVDTIIEVKISISMKSTTENRLKSRFGIGDPDGEEEKASSFCAAVSATYSSKYQYSVDGASLVRTKLVPVPAPAILTERIRALMEELPTTPEAAAAS